MFITPPEPFQFNPLKHHLAFVKSFISHHREKNTAPEDLADRLAALGANYTDMYCGGLGVSQLCLEMKEELLKIGAYGHQKYRAWLFDDDSEYKELRLSDGSCWTLRWGHTGHYIHFHPSRASDLVKRLKSNAIKAAILYQVCFPHMKTDLKLINHMREQYLKLSPVKFTNAFFEANAFLKC
jgi:hypothetical protein